MKTTFLYIIFFCALAFSSCNVQKQKVPVEKPSVILSSFMNFWYYWNDNIKLSRDYIAYDENNKQITKKVFLKKLISGDYLPLRLESNDSSLYYGLYKLNNTVNEGISRTIARYGDFFYRYYQMEGKPLPGFNFVDLKGNIYNKETCKGKIVVLNYWFIGCHACVKEMPELNRIVDKYKDRKDILFVSLAMDSVQQLKKFLSKTIFDYAVVPNKRDYMKDTAHIFMWPTQMIINKKGLVANVMNDADELKFALKIEATR